MSNDPDLAGFIPWHLPGTKGPLGYLRPDAAAILTADGLLRDRGSGLLLAHPGSLNHQLEHARSTLFQAGLIEPMRNEAMPVRHAPGGRALARIDRSAMRILGLWATKVHVNGLVFSPGSQHPDVWLSRRSGAATAAPNTYDTLVAGGHSAGTTVRRTMIRESGEEVGIAAEIARTARLVARHDVVYVSPQGLHREQLVIFDLRLGSAFQPAYCDGEICESIRLSWTDFCGAIADGKSVKHSSLLVCRDLVARQAGRPGSMV